jgi:hypothetical protein
MEADDVAEPAPVIGPLTLDRWPAFEDLFGLERGGNSGCWCMWPRMSRKEWHAIDRASRRAVRMDSRTTAHADSKSSRQLMSHTDPVVSHSVVVVQVPFALLIRPVVVTPS